MPPAHALTQRLDGVGEVQLRDSSCITPSRLEEGAGGLDADALALEDLGVVAQVAVRSILPRARLSFCFIVYCDPMH